MPLSEHQLDHLITAADPSRGTPDARVLEQTWTGVRTDLDTGAAVPFRRRSRLIRVGIGVAAVAALTAAAPFIATRTGHWNEPEWISAGGPGEEYRLNGTDFAQQLAALGTDIPFPDGPSRQKVLGNMVAEYSGGHEDAAMTTGALRADLARGAVCAWARMWTAANAAGDTRQRDAAVDALAGALTWTAVTDVDPHPSIDGEKTAVGNYPTVFGDLPGIIDAARHREPATLADRLENGASAYCVYNDDSVSHVDEPQTTVPSAPTHRPRGVPTTPPSAPASGK
jgi:hypothetical protein